MSYSSALLLPLLCGSVSQYRAYGQPAEGNNLTAYIYSHLTVIVYYAYVCRST